METMNNALDEVCSQNILQIKEQNLTLILDKNYALFDYKDDMYLIIGNELEYSNGKYTGDLMAGVIRLEKVIENDVVKTIPKLVLPFSKRLLYVKFLDNNRLCLVYSENKSRSFKVINLNEDKTLKYEDYAFLFEEELPNVERVKRVLARTVH